MPAKPRHVLLLIDHSDGGLALERFRIGREISVGPGDKGPNDLPSGTFIGWHGAI